jgi:hypothetical protein
MTDKIQRSYNPLHPSKTRSRHTQPRTPAPPPKERIRQNPLHNVKQPKPGIEYPHDSSPAIRKIKPRLQTVDHANHTVFTATTLSGPTAHSARCLRGRPALVEPPFRSQDGRLLVEPLSVTVGSWWSRHSVLKTVGSWWSRHSVLKTVGSWWSRPGSNR